MLYFIRWICDRRFEEFAIIAKSTLVIVGPGGRERGPLPVPGTVLGKTGGACTQIVFVNKIATIRRMHFNFS